MDIKGFILRCRVIRIILNMGSEREQGFNYLGLLGERDGEEAWS